MYVNRTQTPWAYLSKCLPTFKLSTLLNLSSQFKDLNMINQSVTHGLTVSYEFFSMHCEQCQSQCWHTNKFRKCSSRTCNVNSHTGMARTRRLLKCFSGQHAQVHREYSHCGDCHTFATSGVGAQQAHSLYEGKKEFP